MRSVYAKQHTAAGASVTGVNLLNLCVVELWIEFCVLCFYSFLNAYVRIAQSRSFSSSTNQRLSAMPWEGKLLCSKAIRFAVCSTECRMGKSTAAGCRLRSKTWQSICVKWMVIALVCVLLHIIYFLFFFWFSSSFPFGMLSHNFFPFFSMVCWLFAPFELVAKCREQHTWAPIWRRRNTSNSNNNSNSKSNSSSKRRVTPYRNAIHTKYTKQTLGRWQKQSIGKYTV